MNGRPTTHSSPISTTHHTPPTANHALYYFLLFAFPSHLKSSPANTTSCFAPTFASRPRQRNELISELPP